jgi:hypothetical protein
MQNVLLYRKNKHNPLRMYSLLCYPDAAFWSLRDVKTYESCSFEHNVCVCVCVCDVVWNFDCLFPILFFLFSFFPGLGFRMSFSNGAPV